jgi:hypothetical protein
MRVDAWRPNAHPAVREPLTRLPRTFVPRSPRSPWQVSHVADGRRLFHSYARKDDEPFVKRLYVDLTTAWFHVWWDRTSMPARGLAFTKEIADAIADSERVLFICGPAALKSDYVTREWTFALEEERKVITPLVRIGRARDLPDPRSGILRKQRWSCTARYSERNGILIRLHILRAARGPFDEAVSEPTPHVP